MNISRQKNFKLLSTKKMLKKHSVVNPRNSVVPRLSKVIFLLQILFLKINPQNKQKKTLYLHIQ